MQYTVHRIFHTTDSTVANNTCLARFSSFPSLHRAIFMQNGICQQSLWFHSTAQFLPAEAILQDNKTRTKWAWGDKKKNNKYY